MMPPLPDFIDLESVRKLLVVLLFSSLRSVCFGRTADFDRYQDGKPSLELTFSAFELPIQLLTMSATLRAAVLSLKTLGREGMQRMTKPEVTSPRLQSPIGPTMKVMSSAFNARIDDHKRNAPQIHPLSLY